MSPSRHSGSRAEAQATFRRVARPSGRDAGSLAGYRGVIERYRRYLPVSAKTPVISLNEGNTPLLAAKNLSKTIGGGVDIYLKCEGFNPTGSFKDRGMTVAVSKAIEEGARAIVCASTGNTSAAAAAYAARAGIRCVVLIPGGAIALGKLSQALMHGAEVLALDGSFDDALRLVRELSQKHSVTLVNSVNPYRIEGQKTAAFEIIETLGDAPDFQFMPVGNAGNITAYWKGYKEFAEAGQASRKPKMMGYEPEGAAAILKGHPIANPQTIASAVRIGNPASWKFAEAARDESGGVIETVTDAEIHEAYLLLAKTEGVFVELASAISVAGLRQALAQGRVPSGSSAVCILTGHGLKDPDSAIKASSKPRPVPADLPAIAAALAL